MSVCPNKNLKEWKDLSNYLGGEHMAYRAFLKNKKEIPSIDSAIVKNIKNGEPIVFSKEEIKLISENDKNYVGTKTGRSYKRVTDFVDDNFHANERDNSKDMAQVLADRQWENIPKNKKLYNHEQKLETYDEFIDRVRIEHRDAAIKGNVMHAEIEKNIHPEKRTEIDNKIHTWIAKLDLLKAAKFKSFLSFLNDRKILKRIFNNVGINILNELKDEQEILRDVAFAEKEVASDLLNLATKIDLLIWHADNTWSIVDWKTGRTFSSSAYLTNILMKYGATTTHDIVDNQRNKGKLDIMLRAFMLKINNPHIRFRNLIIAHIADSVSGAAVMKDSEQNVEVVAFLEMLQKFCKDKEVLTKLGLSPALYEDIIKESPDAFNPAHYVSNYNTDIITEIVRNVNQKTPNDILQEKINELQMIVARREHISMLEPYDLKRARKLMTEIFQMTGTVNAKIDLESTEYPDIRMLEKFFMSYGDTTHPLVTTWIQFKRERKLLQERKVHAVLQEFDQLVLDFKKDMAREMNMPWLLFGRYIDYDKMYGWAFVEEDVTGLNYKRERLLHDKETEPELQARYNSLSAPKKNLLNFMNKVTESYFFGDDALGNQIVTNFNKKDRTVLDMHNITSKDVTFTPYKGFFFKIPLSRQEIRKSHGGMFSKESIKLKTLYSLTRFTENNYTIPQKSYYRFIPLQYMGNSRVNAEKLYSRNLEIAFKQGMEAMEYKRFMDNPLQMGNVLKVTLENLKDSESGEKMYPQLADFIETKLLHDIMGVYIKPKQRGSNVKKARMTILTPGGWKDEPIDSEQVIKALMNWVTMTVMWLKPLQGAGNGIHGMMLTHRDGLKGSLSLKLHGINNDAVDFTYKDIIKAELEYTKYLKDALTGDILRNKMFILAKKFNYFGNNYDYATMEKTLITKSMKHLSPQAAYMFHSLPEEFLSMTTMAAQLMHMKDQKTGKSLWDSYSEPKEINGVWDVYWEGGVRGKEKSGVEMSPDGTETAVYKDLTELSAREIQRLKRVHERLQGGYRREEAAYIEAYVLGKFFIQLKKYFPRLIINALHSKKEDNDLGYYKQLFKEDGTPLLKDGELVYEWQKRLTEGRWVTIAGVFANLITGGMASQNFKWSNLAPEQKQNILEAAITLMFYAQFYGLYLLLFNNVDDDDTAKRWWKMYLVDNLSQQYNFYELFKTSTEAFTPVAFERIFQTTGGITKLLFSTANWALSGDDQAFLNNKGEIKGLTQIIKSVPGLAAVYDLMNKFSKDKSGILPWDVQEIRFR